MRNSTEIYAGHPLFKELRNGLFWHRTGPKEYRQIQTDGVISPNNGRVDRWGKPYTCQQLGGVSMFDFTTESEDKVLWEAFKWQQFLGDFTPVTVLLGVRRDRLTGKLIPYPDNKDGTTGNVIPWVETCHCGSISISAITSYLLICPVDYRRFKKFAALDEVTLTSIEQEFEPIVTTERKRLDDVHAAQLGTLRRVQQANRHQR